MLISKPLKTEDFLQPITLKKTNIRVRKKKNFFEKLKKLFLKKFQKKSFEKFVCLLKPSQVVSARKTQKTFFSVRSAFIFSAHWSAFSSSDFRLAVFDRKINGGEYDSFVVTSGWGEHLHFYGKFYFDRTLILPQSKKSFSSALKQSWIIKPIS